ncbi:MAG: hypothetical protein QG673_2092 [Pseudomonadota bacterium]|nr:hypothetical protein [Pseudomonadota bacterium]
MFCGKDAILQDFFDDVLSICVLRGYSTEFFDDLMTFISKFVEILR